WKEKIQNAWRLRQYLNIGTDASTNVFRLVHGEGDGLPGLIVDYYNGTAVIQAHTVGMYKIRNILIEVLSDVLGDKLTAIYDKSEKTLPFKANIQHKDALIYGQPNTDLV